VHQVGVQEAAGVVAGVAVVEAGVEVVVEVFRCRLSLLRERVLVLVPVREWDIPQGVRGGGIIRLLRLLVLLLVVAVAVVVVKYEENREEEEGVAPSIVEGVDLGAGVLGRGMERDEGCRLGGGW
jgi:hypothetical protein